MPDEKLETILQLAGKVKNWKREEDSSVITRRYQDGGSLSIRGKCMDSIHLDYINYQITYHGSIKDSKNKVDIFVTRVEGSKKDGWGCYELGGIDPDTWYGLFAYLNGVKGTEIGNYTGNKRASYNQINPRIKELYESIDAEYKQKQEEKKQKLEQKEKVILEAAIEKAKGLLK